VPLNSPPASVIAITPRRTNASARWIKSAAVVRLNPFEFFTKVMLPSAAPSIFTGLRVGIGLSWLAITAAEMLIGGVGLGFFIRDAWNSSHISEIILALVSVGLIVSHGTQAA
jgi:ABC-type nitrate/sulfonate/bicarbonate transport system permease component